LGEIVRRLEGAPGEPGRRDSDDRILDRLRVLWDAANQAWLDALDAVTLAEIVDDEDA
jgi:DNA-binding IscR family transcriptional regulator